MVKLFYKKTVRQAQLAGKNVLLRADFNVPISKNGDVIDDYRIRKTLPTIEHIIGSGASLGIIAHLGRPKNGYDKNLSLEPVAKKLQDLLHKTVIFVPDCIGPQAKEAWASKPKDAIILFENVRFYNEEAINDDIFATQLADGFDIFVQDAFGIVHRKHASIEAITHHLPSYAGILLENEVTTITKAIEHPDLPLAVVVGGAKIADKIDLLHTFIDKADYVAVVGAMANTFLLALGYDVGASLVDPKSVKNAKEIIHRANTKSKKQEFTFYLPHDVVVSTAIDVAKPTRVVDIAQHTWADITAYPARPKKHSFTVGKQEIIADIGPMSASAIAGAISLSKTVIWNGTAGITETLGLNGAAAPYAHGTKIIAEALCGEHAGHKNKPFSIVGGGDTVAYVESVDGLREQLGHVSTGGGASLDVLAGKKLPGVEALLSA